MPGYLVHQGATVQCSHAGQAQPMITDMRVKVGGQFIVTQPNPYTVTACPFSTAAGPNPCVSATWTSAATRVKASGQAVLLQDSHAQTAPNAVPLTVIQTQTRVKGI